MPFHGGVCDERPNGVSRFCWLKAPVRAGLACLAPEPSLHRPGAGGTEKIVLS
jgi:hypothetical protein